MREVRANARCPCESGRRYGACCKRKAFKWLIDGEGDYHKQIPLVPEALEVFDQAAEDFRRVFDREPRKNSDPVFLCKYLISEEELERQTVESMQRANVRPHIIYAYRKTGGLLLSRQNEKLASTKDVDDWDAAIDEYYRLKKNPPAPHPVDLLFQSLEDELDSCIICLGYVLEHGLSTDAQRMPSSSEYFSVDEYALLCATRSMKTLRAIKVLLNENIGADGLSLARHLLESYFQIVFAIAQPNMLKHLTDAPIGLKLGTHDFARSPNGRVDSRKILRKRDGAEYLGHISYYKMAESSPHKEDLELFDYFYSFLSEFTHPSVAGFRLVLGEHGKLDALSNELQSEAFFYSICLATLILDELRKLPVLSAEAKIDIATVVRRVGAKAEVLVAALFEDDEPPKSFAVLRDRLMTVGA